MKKEKGDKEQLHWTACKACHGLGKKNKGRRKKAKYSKELSVAAEERAVAHYSPCSKCGGAGIVPATSPPIPDEQYPHLAIIGGGIGGIALAVACLHRGIPFTLYERDQHLNARAQGYGLTLQQAGKVMKDFGLLSLDDQVISTKHVVHQTDGKVLGEWGLRKWQQENQTTPKKRSNFHIPRQSLRSALFLQLGQQQAVEWGHQLLDYTPLNTEEIELTFLVNGHIKKERTNLLVGADGIRSTVRKLSLGEEVAPLHYLGCMVILGICPLAAIQEETTSELLDSATVFQTANGEERIYIMPYTADSIMWQLSFPMDENEAIALAAQGKQALYEEACRRTPWHNPIPSIVKVTAPTLISGYPVYDREVVDPANWKEMNAVTLLGDAAHPMSPFKGQGANQALLDALLLARLIVKGCTHTPWREKGLKTSVLHEFESLMLERSAAKVKGSAQAAQLLHSTLVLKECNQPRGTLVNYIS
ncbi:FAD-dependent monooxygenase [Myroides sp. NP-2]|uniref:FAD-dependent oxidoreductase n=1 Tax=Myroides sp. NP-2 TaxID=2759945 RepID=UPI0015FD205A|nr:NAD(P)/FAD-dependent oxidoreductase [Myroides sp. NP-2]MBB1150463.1 FAD-dependent monooxygenase [Myroides sp. NP-2]